MTLAVAEALSPNKPNIKVHGDLLAKRVSVLFKGKQIIIKEDVLDTTVLS